MPDEVDRIIAAWQLEAPGLDTEPLAVLSRVSRPARHLDLARKQCFAAHGAKLEAIEEPFAIEAEAPFAAAFANIRIAAGAGKDADALQCP